MSSSTRANPTRPNNARKRVPKAYINRLQERLAALENNSEQHSLLEATAGRSRSPDLTFHTYDFVPSVTGNIRKVFDLRWDGTRKLTAQDVPDMSALPTKDFALYLINSVKFHCGWLYSLFDEDIFMERFRLFHENPSEYARAEPLWFVHYLLVLAFGKAFVVQSTKSRRPPGGDFFIQAMKLMPDFNFFDCDIIEEMQVLCCAALYLQSVDHIQQAYRLLISLLGLPLSIADETISARFPDFPGQPQKLEALKIHVDFCRVLAKINQSAYSCVTERSSLTIAAVYGLEGKLDCRYLGATQSVLKSIATVTERLNKSFEIQASEGMAGISRISAHLHLMQHQMCTESAQQILRILSSLSEQGLLETFLRFDQDAAFTATIALLMAAAIDSSLLPDHTPWTQRAYGLFDEMNSRGNLVANMVAAELKQLEDLLKGFLTSNDSRPVVATQGSNTPRQGFMNDIDNSTGSVTDYTEPFSLESDDDFGLGLNYELSAEQLLNIANSLDIDSLTWPWPEDPMAEDVDGA
uniref:Transcription factor domain-containing protein n=1 Tax=Fusarium oxysporum (strain Fo5176) TaxID=660025 RepID=A0A0D2Y957_FUSOF